MIFGLSHSRNAVYKTGGVQKSSMEKYVFTAEKELIPPDLITQPMYVLNLIALIITIAFCFVLFRIT